MVVEHRTSSAERRALLPSHSERENRLNKPSITADDEFSTRKPRSRSVFSSRPSSAFGLDEVEGGAAGSEEMLERDELIKEYSVSPVARSKKYTRVFLKSLLAVATTLIYAFNGIIIGFANQVPNVQFDFQSPGTTGRDLFHPKTLKFRNQCASDIRSSGGFEFRNNQQAGSCWNEFLAGHQWGVGKNREWHGWLHPAPFMDVIGMMIRINGNIDATLTLTDKDGFSRDAKVSSTTGTETDSPIIRDIDLAKDIKFKINIDFKDNYKPTDTDLISIMYFMPGGDNDQNPVVLPFAPYTSPSDLRDVAESEDQENINAKDINVKVAKGVKFVPPVVVLCHWTALLICCLLGCALFDIYAGFTGNRREGGSLVKTCLDWRKILLFSPAAAGWGLADVCEVIALGQLDPVIYGVLSQMRLLGTALLATVILKRKFTILQWFILGILTLLVISFSIAGADSRGGGGVIEWIGACGKLTLAVVCGIYGEQYMKQDDSPYAVQVFWVACVATPVVALALFASLLKPRVSFFDYGFFGGFDFGWDQRTIVLVMFYMCYFTVPSLCAKHFSALTKSLCNAVALLVLYFADHVITGKSPDPAKVTLTLAIVSTVGLYAMSKEWMKIPKPDHAVYTKINLTVYTTIILIIFTKR